MARTATVSDDQLLLQIMEVFRAEGFQGASLSKLAAATGLKRASLYHRFPGGKNQMAEESLGAIVRWLEGNVHGALQSEGSPQDRLKAAAQGFATLYDGGKDQCLINLFGSQAGAQAGLRSGVQALLSTLILGIAKVIEDAGFEPDEARRRAFAGVVQLQGALVVSQAFADTAPFAATMARWADDLLAGAEAADVAPQPGAPSAEPEPPKEDQAPPPSPPAPTPAAPAQPSIRAAVAAHLKGLRS